MRVEFEDAEEAEQMLGAIAESYPHLIVNLVKTRPMWIVDALPHVVCEDEDWMPLLAACICRLLPTPDGSHGTKHEFFLNQNIAKRNKLAVAFLEAIAQAQNAAGEPMDEEDVERLRVELLERAVP